MPAHLFQSYQETWTPPLLATPVKGFFRLKSSIICFYIYIVSHCTVFHFSGIIQTGVLIFGGENMKMQIGQTLEIIYEDKSGKITQRQIEVCEIKNGRIRAICFTSDAPRVFIMSNILSWMPIKNHKKASIAVV